MSDYESYKGYDLWILQSGKVLIRKQSPTALDVVRNNMADAKEFVDVWTMSDEEVHQRLAKGE